jgi:hypothetical protein
MHHLILVVVSVFDMFVAILSSLFQFLDASPPAATFACRCSPPLFIRLLAPGLTQPADALTEVNVDPAVVDKDIVHFGVCLLAASLFFKLDESILEAVARLFVADDLAAEDLTEPAEDQLKVLICGHWVQLADKKNVFGWLNLGKREVSHHFKRKSLGRSLAFPALPLCLRGGLFVGLWIKQLLILRNPNGGELGICRRRRAAWLPQARRIGIRVVEHNGMLDADVDQRMATIINDCIVDLLKHVETLDNFAEDGSLSIQIVGFVTQCDNELRPREPLIGVCDGASLEVLKLWMEEGWKCLVGWVAGYQAPDGAAAV